MKKIVHPNSDFQGRRFTMKRRFLVSLIAGLGFLLPQTAVQVEAAAAQEMSFNQTASAVPDQNLLCTIIRICS